jgi:CheY-like chemotaxis protein
MKKALTRRTLSGGAAAAPGRLKVLVVDDDLFVLRVAERRLTGAGYDVAVRLHPLGTSRAIAEESPDVVLLDVEMPALSGDALANVLRQRCAHVAVILHSARTEEALAAIALSVGAVGWIRKTADDRHFIQRFEALLAGRVDIVAERGAR